MFPIDTNLLISIGVSVFVVSFLILVKIIQEKTNRRLEKASKSPAANRESEGTTQQAQTIQRFQEETKQNKCPHFFGYLYNNARSNPENSAFPDECYGCPKLVECLNSPEAIQRIYRKKQKTRKKA